MDRFLCIQAFVRVAETHSFASAARQLGVTPSVITSRIKQLEGFVGNPERVGRRPAQVALGGYHLVYAERVAVRLPGSGPLGAAVAKRRVDNDQRRALRLVDAHLSGDALQLTKGKDGVWSVTIGPVEPDIYTYSFVIDGARAIDLANPVTKIGANVSASLVEVMGDHSVTLPPLNSFLVKDLIKGTHVAKLLGAFRQMPPVDMDALESVLLRVSEMVCELPMLMEMDINPLIVDEHGVLAADARVVVEFRPPNSDRYSHMAIYPYPTHLVTRLQLADGMDITIRPIRPEDAELVQDFVRNLSEQSRYFRFMNSVQELSQSMLVRFTQIDYSREMALIAVTEEQGKEVEIGVARYATNPDGQSCEFALAISDSMHGKGLGQKLMTALMDAARSKGLKVIEGEVLKNNSDMLQLMDRLGFIVSNSSEDDNIKSVRKVL